MILDKRLIHYNFSSRRGVPIKYIVIHDTGNNSPGAGALNHYKYFSGGNRNASAHYFVDDKGVVQIIEDNLAAWHCGDGRGRFGITNSNSIGVEICINSDGDYKKALENTRKLVRELVKYYKIPIKNVVRHFDASHKRCPGTMASDNWRAWWEFKESL
jgi:N-acetylmuramoyl-L-alanine amidase